MGEGIVERLTRERDEARSELRRVREALEHSGFSLNEHGVASTVAQVCITLLGMEVTYRTLMEDPCKDAGKGTPGAGNATSRGR